MEEQRPKKLLDQASDAIRLKHYSIHIEQAYVGWIERYILFHDVCTLPGWAPIVTSSRLTIRHLYR